MKPQGMTAENGRKLQTPNAIQWQRVLSQLPHLFIPLIPPVLRGGSLGSSASFYDWNASTYLYGGPGSLFSFSGSSRQRTPSIIILSCTSYGSEPSLSYSSSSSLSSLSLSLSWSSSIDSPSRSASIPTKLLMNLPSTKAAQNRWLLILESFSIF